MNMKTGHRKHNEPSAAQQNKENVDSAWEETRKIVLTMVSKCLTAKIVCISFRGQKSSRYSGASSSVVKEEVPLLGQGIENSCAALSGVSLVSSKLFTATYDCSTHGVPHRNVLRAEAHWRNMFSLLVNIIRRMKGVKNV